MFVAFLVFGCSSIKVISDYDDTIDFTQYKTYEYFGWSEESDKVMNRFDRERIEKAFGEEFAARGMKYVEKGGDLIVTLFIVVEEKTQKSAYTTGFGGGYGGYYGGYYGYGPGYGWGSSYSTTHVSEYDYKVGTLICDVHDVQNKKLIWEGIGTKTIVENPEKREKTIPYAVKLMMSKYPVKPLPEK